MKRRRPGPLRPQLDDRAIEKMKRLRGLGVTKKNIAIRFGVSITTVTQRTR